MRILVVKEKYCKRSRLLNQENDAESPLVPADYEGKLNRGSKECTHLNLIVCYTMSR